VNVNFLSLVHDEVLRFDALVPLVHQINLGMKRLVRIFNVLFQLGTAVFHGLLATINAFFDCLRELYFVFWRNRSS
jgi:hypothetical protein